MSCSLGRPLPQRLPCGSWPEGHAARMRQECLMADPSDLGDPTLFTALVSETRSNILRSPARGCRHAMKVLVVDDHAIVRQGVRSLLETNRSMQVCGEAVDGREAIARAM